MLLSELVFYLNHLDTLVADDIKSKVTQSMSPVVHAVRSNPIQYGAITGNLQRQLEDIQINIDKFYEITNDLKKQIKTSIEGIEHKYLSESYRLYDKEMSNDANEYILNRRPSLSDNARDYVRGRIIRYGDWHYPGMIIRPGLEPWVADLVSLDPLYLVDINRNLLAPSVERFNPEYQRRLCLYNIKESMDGPILEQLPDNQFSFVLAYNYFPFKPLELIRAFLREIFDKLRPGGVFAFTFNNCDLAAGVALAERSFMCYTPGRLIYAAASSVGFDVIQTYQIDASTTWVEVEKPGEKTSLRGGQTLAKVVAKSKYSQHNDN